MAITINEIARLANVSRGTVDKVLNDRPGVKPATREKVMKIAQELNYRPNFLAKALVNSKAPLKLGIILTPEYNPFIQELLKGIQDAQEEFSAFGLEIVIKMMNTLEPAEQLSIIHELVDDGVNGMAVFPIQDPQIIALLNQLIQEHIAVITFNSKVDDINHLSFIGQNHYNGGRTAAQLLNMILPENGKIGIIASSMNLSCHQERLRGFQDKLAECNPKLNIVDIRTNQDRKEEGFKIALEYCNQFQDLTGLYVTGGGIAGIASALEVAGKARSIKIVCHDLIPDAVSLLKSGVVNFVLGQEPTLQGYQIVKVLFEYLMKNIVPEKVVDIPITIFVSESL